MDNSEITDKQIRMVNTALEDLMARQEKFINALERLDMQGVVEAFNEEQLVHLMNLPDMVDDPYMKVVILEKVLDVVHDVKTARPSET